MILLRINDIKNMAAQLEETGYECYRHDRGEFIKIPEYRFEIGTIIRQHYGCVEIKPRIALRRKILDVLNKKYSVQKVGNSLYLTGKK